MRGWKKLAIHDKVNSMFNRRGNCIHSILLASDASVKREEVDAEVEDYETSDGDRCGD